MANEQNIKTVIPFFAVADMEKSLQFYVNGLGFSIMKKWIPEQKIEWCLLQRDGGSLMLQEFRKTGHDSWQPGSKVGVGVSIYFICEDALTIYRELKEKGVNASEPFVGNNMWVTSVYDPDGYKIEFESDTDVPEETAYSEWIKK
ncbi:MAG: VOC family protein [Chitinophagaceae bacterium]